MIPSMFSGLAGQIFTVIQLLLITASYSTETNAKTRAQYSKFSQANDKPSAATWPSRTAMMVIYTPAFIVTITLLALGMQDVNLPLTIPAPSLAAVLCAIQFAKRCLEVLFLHSYSGRTDRGTPTQISVYYTLIATLIAYCGGRKDHDNDATITMTMMIIGTILFAVGITGNFYHHYLLSKLRTGSTKSTTSKYVAPKGGLFSCVAAPHYLFELIGWLGIALSCHHLNAYLVFAGMSSYLAGRSVAQNDFNRRKFDEKDWPRERRCIIPFVF